MKDASHYRKRAEAVRAEAVRATVPEIRKQLLDIAEQYERMAIQAADLAAERHAKISDPPEK
jgi:hypothetical protein